MQNSSEVTLVPLSWDGTGAYLDGLAEAPDGPILHRRDEVG